MRLLARSDLMMMMMMMIRVKTMENCDRFVFYNNFFFHERPKTKQPALCDMLRHFHGLYSHRPLLSTNYARIRSVIVKNIILKEI